MTGLRTFALALTSCLILWAIGFSVASCVDKAQAIEAECPVVLDAGPPTPRPCAAEGAAPTDYRPLVPAGDAPPTVAELREQCAADTNEHGLIHVIATPPYTIVHCWSGKADRHGFVGEDRNVWSRAVYEGP